MYVEIQQKPLQTLVNPTITKPYNPTKYMDGHNHNTTYPWINGTIQPFQMNLIIQQKQLFNVTIMQHHLAKILQCNMDLHECRNTR